MNDMTGRPEAVHLKEEELLNRLPEKIGKVTLNYDLYPGKDLYSDGNIEDEILAIVKDASKVEYPVIIEERKSWPILYHLSPLRGNIVDWLPISKQDKVLEIGSGCGAITEILSDKAGSVTCVELSAKRSLINAYRNQDKDNIEIILGNFTDIEPTLANDYDYICLIGVFEYGQSYVHTQNPYEDFLKTIMKHVKDNGRVVIAIENKFGLKYWAGCKEDHVGEYFKGLEGYPEGGSARTFTRKGLESIFKNCNVQNYAFYYPYPDYKFATTIYSDDRLPGMGELTDNMRNFDRDRMLLFNEKYVFDRIVKDNLFDIFANSYMAVIGPKPEIAYTKFSNDRAQQFVLKTQILDTPEGRVVRKIPLSEEAKAHIQGMERSYELLKARYEGSGLSVNPCKLAEDGSYVQFPFELGITLEEKLDQCLEQEDTEGFLQLFNRYYELVSYGEEQRVADYDLIFANILIDGDKWTLIDYEWTFEEQIRADEIAFRALYCYILEEEKRNKIDFERIMNQLGITQQEAEEYREKEAKFQKLVTGKRQSMGEIRATIGTYAIDPQTLMKDHLQKILDQRIQVYYDYGNGYSEDNSEYIPDIYVDDNQIEAEITVGGSVRNLRIDPADESCIVKIEELLFNGQPIPLQKKYMESNGKQMKNGCFLFATQDPNISIKISQLPITTLIATDEKKLNIKMQISRLTKTIAEDCNIWYKMLF